MGKKSIKYNDDMKEELAAWCEKKKETPSDDLLTLIKHIAQTGETCYSWKHLRKLVAWKLKSVLDAVTSKQPIVEVIDDVTYDQRREKMFKRLEDFKSPPFTIQRLCELLIKPNLYPESRKYFFAIEKLINVSSVLPTLSPQEYDKVVLQRQKTMEEEKEKAKEVAAATAAAVAARRADPDAMQTDDNDSMSDTAIPME